jgi:hypothetical protein
MSAITSRTASSSSMRRIFVVGSLLPWTLANHDHSPRTEIRDHRRGVPPQAVPAIHDDFHLRVALKGARKVLV